MRVKDRRQLFGDATQSLTLMMCVWLGVHVKELLCRSALPSDTVFMPALVGVSVKEVEWWLRHGVATLGVRERTATQVIVWEDIMARKAKTVEIVNVIGRYTKHDKWWVVAFDDATEVYETGTVVTVKPQEKDAHKVIIQVLKASSIVVSDEELPTLYYTYTKVSSK